MVVIKHYKSIISVVFLLILAILSNMFLGNEKYMLVAMVAAIISAIPFFAKFEQSTYSSRELVIIAVMIGLCVAGRFIFTLIPHFKPVTALVIITGICFGADAGFVTGAFTALLSNMQHGQGPWTVFQMTIWGIIGFLAGTIQKRKGFENKYVLIIFSGITGIIYSLVMDIYTTLSADSVFSIQRYLSYVLFSIPVMIEYIISNIIFVVLLKKPLGKKLTRLKTKYGIFTEEST